MIVYNIEDFIIKEMFRPFQNLIVSEENLPEDYFDRQEAYSKRVNEYIKQFRKEPLTIIYALQNNKQAYQCVFGRLSKLNVKFYKWLRHPFIEEFNSIICTFRYAQSNDLKGCVKK